MMIEKKGSHYLGDDPIGRFSPEKIFLPVCPVTSSDFHRDFFLSCPFFAPEKKIQTPQ
jgi:hypothetical protein